MLTPKDKLLLHKKRVIEELRQTSLQTNRTPAELLANVIKRRLYGTRALK